MADAFGLRSFRNTSLRKDVADTSSSASLTLLTSLTAGLNRLRAEVAPHRCLSELARQGLDRLAMPGAGATLSRWQALEAVASRDLSLVKLYEGHTDAIAIMTELGAAHAIVSGDTWGTWAAEGPGARVIAGSTADGRTVLNGTKLWCSGAEHVSQGLLTAWREDGNGPQLVRVAMAQPSVKIGSDTWKAVGMADSSSVDVTFTNAQADLVGKPGDYLSRPGFWQGGVGIAACWYGGARMLADCLARSVHASVKAASTESAERAVSKPPSPFRLAALGHVDVAMRSTAALLRESAEWIDAHPAADASAVAFRTRLAAERTATLVLDEVGRALGAAPFCKDARFARMAADLPVFIRQSHGEQDFAALGERVAATSSDSSNSVGTARPWTL